MFLIFNVIFALQENEILAGSKLKTQKGARGCGALNVKIKRCHLVVYKNDRCSFVDQQRIKLTILQNVKMEKRYMINFRV